MRGCDCCPSPICSNLSKSLLLERLYVFIDTLHFARYAYALGAMAHALVASYAVVGLAQLGYGAVVAHEEGATHLGITFVLAALGDVAFVDTLVVVEQDGRDIEAIGTGHTVLTVVAGDGGVLGDELGRIVEKLVLLLGEGLQG